MDPRVSARRATDLCPFHPARGHPSLPKPIAITSRPRGTAEPFGLPDVDHPHILREATASLAIPAKNLARRSE